ncbi:MAG: hypothetical protein K2J99_01170 [Lachnospiraceae bacterium]|nr:hypothetical protein [Lachnospiraceae bacterium]
MNKQHKITIVVFCIGVLLCGIGGGIAFTEFSSLAYGGRQIIGETEMVTKDFDVEFEPGEEPWDIIGINGIYRYGGMDIQEDSSVPVNTVRFRVTYNTKRGEPFTELNLDDKRIYFGWSWLHFNDEMALIMEAKDVVLQNLKERKLVSFDTVELEQVEVFVNPKSVDDVRITY